MTEPPVRVVSDGVPLPSRKGKPMAQPGKQFDNDPGSPPPSKSPSRQPDQKQLDFELEFFASILEGTPDYVVVLRILGSLLSLKGRFVEGLKLDKRLIRLRPEDALAHYNLACSYSLLDRPEHSLRMLRKAIELGYRDFRYMREDHDLDPIKQDPRFRQILREYDCI